MESKNESTGSSTPVRDSHRVGHLLRRGGHWPDDKLFPVGVICRPEVLATVVVTILPAIVSTLGSRVF